MIKKFIFVKKVNGLARRHGFKVEKNYLKSLSEKVKYMIEASIKNVRFEKRKDNTLYQDDI